MDNAGKDARLAEIEETLGVRGKPTHPLYKFMNWDDVRTMARSPLISFGAHTVDHVALARVPREEMRRQIREVRRNPRTRA